jgi:hypothetical protein
MEKIEAKNRSDLTKKTADPIGSAGIFGSLQFL